MTFLWTSCKIVAVVNLRSRGQVNAAAPAKVRLIPCGLRRANRILSSLLNIKREAAAAMKQKRGFPQADAALPKIKEVISLKVKEYEREADK
jgi:hypothetical protein